MMMMGHVQDGSRIVLLFLQAGSDQGSPGKPAGTKPETASLPWGGALAASSAAIAIGELADIHPDLAALPPNPMWGSLLLTPRPLPPRAYDREKSKTSETTTASYS